MAIKIPRYLKLFSPACGGDVTWRNIGDPLELRDNVPTGGESLQVKWTEPDGSTSCKSFYVGVDLSLDDNGETPPDDYPLANVPDEQFLASTSMAAILAGQVHPGTDEYLLKVPSQENELTFKTVLGDAKIKSITLVDTGDPNTDGSIYDVEYMRVDQPDNTKTVQSDALTLSQYENRSGSHAISVNCVPSAITAHFGKKTQADLGDAESTLRSDIVEWLKEQRFYV